MTKQEILDGKEFKFNFNSPNTFFISEGKSIMEVFRTEEGVEVMRSYHCNIEFIGTKRMKVFIGFCGKLYNRTIHYKDLIPYNN